MKDKTPTLWKWFPWILGFVVVETAKLAWLQGLDFKFPSTLYDVFPLLGLLAWSIMWTHYVIGEMRHLNPALPKSMTYHKVSSVVVLTFLLIHPGILAIEQFRNGFGLPPQSIYEYVGKSSIWLVVLGTIALLLFLSFEVFIRLKENAIVKKYWWLVNLSQSIAMSFIFIHALKLGTHLQDGWFRIYWISLGIILVPCMLHTHWSDLKTKK